MATTSTTKPKRSALPPGADAADIDAHTGRILGPPSAAQAAPGQAPAASAAAPAAPPVEGSGSLSPQQALAARLGYRAPEAAGPMLWPSEAGVVLPAPSGPDPRVVAARQAVLNDPYEIAQREQRNRERERENAAAVTAAKRERLRAALKPTVEGIISQVIEADRAAAAEAAETERAGAAQ